MQWSALVTFLGFGVCVYSDGNTPGDKYDLINEETGKRVENYDIGNIRQSPGNRFGKNDNRGYKRNQRERYNEEEIQRLDEIFGYTGPTANDEPENLVRPCALEDWQCIRKYFAANSKCTPTYGPIPDPITISPTIFFAAVNLTTNFVNSVIRGLSTAKVNDFYVNKVSGNLVIAIEVQNFNQTTPRAYYRYRRTGKESVILAGYSTINFRALTFTAVIPKVPHLRLDLADVHVDIEHGFPSYFIGPEATNSTDPDVVMANAQFPILLPFLIREGLFFESQLLTAIFIQKYICDFGLKLVGI